MTNVFFSEQTRLTRRLLMATMAFLLPLGLCAQKDAKAKEWLDKSSAAFHEAGALSISFTLNIKDVSNKITESFDGILELKGIKFHLNTPDNEIWFDGKTQWGLLKAYDEVQISEPSAQETQILNPAAILSIYKKNCNYKYKGEKTDEKGRKVQEVELIPQAKENEMTRIVMHIGSNDSMPSKIHIFYKNGIENVIHINKYQKNTALKDTSFVFDAKKYPDAEIIDLR
ncbi:MAG: outer-membrane lipoprotein carrier protein LolA [Dysgonamonadaceae bacterium]|jgi:outer membrane lipoprotein-sorting protein|nr:outer-membrane lipoprotein carrier protein LolA [Dysgonamonadaceae bacterium]